MLKAVVVASVWSTRHVPGVPPGALLEVEVEGTSSRIVAYDAVGCGPGEVVLVTTGSVAASFLSGEHPPIDALVIAAVDPDQSGPPAVFVGAGWPVQPAPSSAHQKTQKRGK